MLPLISSSAPPLLASSGGDDKFIIFIVVALIAGLAKVIEWVKKRKDSQEESQLPEAQENRRPTELDMGEILRRAILEEQQNGGTAPAQTAEEQHSRRHAARRTERPVRPIAPQWEPAESVQPDIMQQAKAALSRPSLEEHAEASINQIYASTSAAYQDIPATGIPTERTVSAAAPRVKPTRRTAGLVRKQGFFDSPESIRKAMLLHEILSQPKGLR